MTDLMDRLHRLGEEQPASVPDETVRRDLLRGRGALLRRRVRRGVAGLSIAAVAAVGAAVVVSHPAADDGGPSIAQPSQRGGSDLGLVAYTGEQQPGFVVAKVPSGFVLQGATGFSLDVARADDTSDLSVFVDKLVVMLESKDAGTPSGAPVKVGAHDGWLRHPEGNQVLTYDDGTRLVTVQAWGSLELSDAQLVEFAAGVTVTAEAQQTRG